MALAVCVLASAPALAQSTPRDVSGAPRPAPAGAPQSREPAAAAAAIAGLEYAPATNDLTLRVSAIGRRELLAALARTAGFRVLFAEDLPDDPITFRAEREPIARVVSRLIADSGIDYVLAYNVSGGVRAAVIAKRGLGAARAALAALENEPQPESEEAKAEKLAKEVERQKRMTNEERDRLLEDTLRAEGEAVPEKFDFNVPPVTVQLPTPPPPQLLGVRPAMQPVPVAPIPLPQMSFPGWVPVTGTDATPPALLAPAKPPK